MTKTEVILGATLIALIIGSVYHFSLNENQFFDSLKNYSTERYGNLSTANRNIIRDTVQLSQFKHDDLGDQSQYIGDKLDARIGYSWQIYIYGTGCKMVMEYSKEHYYNRWAVFQDHGPFKFCFHLSQTKKCRGELNSRMLAVYSTQSSDETWGSSFSQNDKVRIRALITEAALRSSTPSDNCIYIRDRLGTGYWAVAIGQAPDRNFGFYACIINQYWALLGNMGPYGWSYMINRYN